MNNNQSSQNEKILNGILPSSAYEQAIESPVYRLSELMFGSLLASYMLGFIGLMASRMIPESGFVNLLLLYFTQYIAVSFAFSYLTASFYLTYHAGILTMHHMPLKHLKTDFLIALTQALTFGLSMLFPALFPLLVGFNLLIASIRQNQEHTLLVEKFYKELQDCCTPLQTMKQILDTQGNIIKPSTRVDESEKDDENNKNREKEIRADFTKEFVKLLSNSNYSELSGWRPVKRNLIITVSVLLFLGIIILFSHYTDKLKIHLSLALATLFFIFIISIILYQIKFWKAYVWRSVVIYLTLGVSFWAGFLMFYYWSFFRFANNSPEDSLSYFKNWLFISGDKPGDTVTSITVISLFSLVVTIVVFKAGHSVLNDRAMFLYNRKTKEKLKMDRQFELLVRAIKDYWQQIISKHNTEAKNILESAKNNLGEDCCKQKESELENQLKEFKERINNLWVEKQN